MDKYEYKLKTEEILGLMEAGAYVKAAEIADTIDWQRVRNTTMLMSVSELYEKIGDYQKSYDTFKVSYDHSEGSRKVLFRLGELALRAGRTEEAIDYYDDYMQIAPKDPNQYILRYKILSAQGAPVEQQIEALEEFKKSEYIEQWAYELAKLYQAAGMTAECLEECDDLILWFSEGQYVYQAMELKMQYKPLTPSQQEKYNKRKEAGYVERPKEENVRKKNDSAEVLIENEQYAVAEEPVPEQMPEVAEETVEKAVEEPKRYSAIGATMSLNQALESLLKEKKPVSEQVDLVSPKIEPEEQVAGQMSIEDILMGWESGTDKEDKMREEPEQSVKEDTAPILPEDIEKLINEIEETEPVPVVVPENVAPMQKPKEIYENMGSVAEELRVDEEENLFEDFDDEFEEEFEEELDDELEEELEELDEDFAEDFDDFEEEEFDETSFPKEEILEADEDDFKEDGFDEEGFYDEDESKSFEPELKDDREIEEEDEIDILSSTTPLSRKETAKMIATGKTAPLPVDEISNALSMSDTGFIVHGRYDLETQSGIGTRAGLTEEQKKLFSYFVPVRGMSEQLVDVLEQDKNCSNRHNTSSTGNLLIIGRKGSGKTVLAVDVVKAIQKQRNIKQGKVAIVTGDSLNKKKISDIFSKLYGGALIIEKAGRMDERTVARLNKAMERETGELLIVLEEQRKPLDRLLTSNREFRRKFTSRLEVPIFINDELVTFGQTYARENGYRIDEMGILALYSRIDALQREDHPVTVAEVKEIMDEAQDHSQKASAKKLVKRVFGKNTDDADRILLTEKDFNI